MCFFNTFIFGFSIYFVEFFIPFLPIWICPSCFFGHSTALKWKNSPVMWNINIFLTCEIGKITNDVENKLKLKIHVRPQMKIWNDQWRMLVYNFKSILIISLIWFRFRSILKISHRFNYKWRDAFWKIPFALQDKWFSNLRFQIF